MRSIGPKSYDGRNEELLDDIACSTSTLLLYTAKDDLAIFLHDMKSNFMVCDGNLQDLVKAHGDAPGDSLEAKVDFLLTNSPYNLRRCGRVDNSSHVIFTPEDMSDFV